MRYRSITLFLIALAVLLLAATPAWTSDPPTDAELRNWWDSLTHGERLDEVRKLDTIERSVPVAFWPPLLIIETDSGEVEAFFGGSLIITVADHLQYNLATPTARLSLSKPANRWIWAGGGFTAGVLIAILMNAISD